MKFRSVIYCTLVAFTFESCALVGIHLHDADHRKQSKYPAFSKETILLGEHSPLRDCFDVTYYDLDVTIDPAKRTLSGWVGITAKANSDIDSLQLDLDQPLFIDAIAFNEKEGTRLDYSRVERAVYVRFAKKIISGQTFCLWVKYHGTPIVAAKPPWKGGAVWKKDKRGRPWCGVACETEGASIWMPCKDVTNDEPDSAAMRFTIADSTVMVVSNGRYLGAEKHDGVTSYQWKVSYPINLYDITYYIGRYTKAEDLYTGISGKELKLQYYVFPEDSLKALNHFKQLKEQIKVYEEVYGEYPWYKDGYKLIESPYEGMEHQTAIAYGTGFKNDLNDSDEYVVLHETGHEWFGNAVTAADLADVWLQEGITTYGESLYLEKRYGTSAGLNHLFIYRLFISNKYPVVGPYGRRYFDYKNSDCYMKGAWIMHSLRNTIDNDSLFFKVIRTFYEENKMKQTDSKKFIETVNRITGDNYQWFFDQYLYNHRIPFLDEEYAADGYIYYRWTNVSPDFNKMKVTLEFGKEKIQVTPESRTQRLKVPDNALGKEFYLDRTKTLFGYRFNKKLHRIYRKLVNQSR